MACGLYCVNIGTKEQKLPTVFCFLPLDHLLHPVAAVKPARILHSVRGDNKQRMLRDILRSGILMDIADVMERAKLLRRRQSKRFFFRTFGAFDMLVDGEPVKLTATELKIVDLLMRNLGRVFPAEEIYRRVWNEEAYATENTVMVHIRRIREKIELNPKEPEYLKVVWGIGYKIEKR